MQSVALGAFQCNLYEQEDDQRESTIDASDDWNDVFQACQLFLTVDCSWRLLLEKLNKKQHLFVWKKNGSEIYYICLLHYTVAYPF